jgi:hypothetical protein
VNNIRFENFYIEGAATAAAITQDSGNNGKFAWARLALPASERLAYLVGRFVLGHVKHAGDERRLCELYRVDSDQFL